MEIAFCKSNIFWSNSTLIAFSVILEAVFWPQRIIKIQMVLRSPNTHAAFVHTHSVRTYFSPKPTDSKKLNTNTLLELISTHEWSDLHKRHNNVYLLLEKPLCFTQRESLYVVSFHFFQNYGKTGLTIATCMLWNSFIFSLSWQIIKSKLMAWWNIFKCIQKTNSLLEISRRIWSSRSTDCALGKCSPCSVFTSTWLILDLVWHTKGIQHTQANFIINYTVV